MVILATVTIILLQLEKVLELDISVIKRKVNLQHRIGLVKIYGQVKVDQQSLIQKKLEVNIKNYGF